MCLSFTILNVKHFGQEPTSIVKLVSVKDHDFEPGRILNIDLFFKSTFYLSLII